MSFFQELGQLYDQGFEASEKYLLDAYNSERAAEEAEFKVVVCNELGSLYRANGKYEESFRYFTEAMEYAEQCYGSEALKYGTILMNRAGTSRMAGDVEKAITDFQISLDIVSRHENCDTILASTWNNLGLAYLAAERYEDAERAVSKSLDILSNSNDRSMIGTGLINLASINVKLGKNADALQYAERALLFYANDPDSANGRYARELVNTLKAVSGPDRK